MQNTGTEEKETICSSLIVLFLLPEKLSEVQEDLPLGEKSVVGLYLNCVVV